MNNKIIITIVVLALLSLLAFKYSEKKEPVFVKEPIFDFKGVQLGAPSTPERVKEVLGVTCGIGADYYQVCNGSVTIAKEPAMMNLVINKNGIVQRISLSLSPGAFEVVTQELIKKFGTPTKTDQSTVQNPMSASFLQVVHLWKNANGNEVFYSKYESTIDNSVLNFSSKEDRELLGKRYSDRDKDI